MEVVNYGQYAWGGNVHHFYGCYLTLSSSSFRLDYFICYCKWVFSPIEFRSHNGTFSIQTDFVFKVNLRKLFVFNGPVLLSLGVPLIFACAYAFPLAVKNATATMIVLSG